MASSNKNAGKNSSQKGNKGSSQLKNPQPGTHYQKEGGDDNDVEYEGGNPRG